MSLATYMRRISPRTWFFFKAWRYKFYNGQQEIWLVRHCVTRGTLAIDIGASIGLYSREMAKSGARVIAFEANRRVAEFAKSVLPSNVVVENIALSSTDREATLRIPVNRRHNALDDLGTIEPRNTLFTGDAITQTIMTRRLDDYDYAHCGFIKMDVEGHEEDVLDGSLRLIETCRPILMMELDDRFNPGIVGRVRKRLGAFGYEAYEFSAGGLHALGREAPAQPNIVHNLLFVPRETKLPALSRWDRLACAIRERFGR